MGERPSDFIQADVVVAGHAWIADHNGNLPPLSRVYVFQRPQERHPCTRLEVSAPFAFSLADLGWYGHRLYAEFGETGTRRPTVHAESFPMEIGRTGSRKKHRSFDWESPVHGRAFQSKRKGGSTNDQSASCTAVDRQIHDHYRLAP